MAATGTQQDIAPKPGVSSGGIQLPGTRISVTGSVTSFSATAFSSTTNLVVVEVQGSNIYATVDGSVPSATNGHQMYAGNIYHWNMATAQNAKFIQQATSATLQASQFTVSSSSVQMSQTSVFLPSPPNTQTTGAGNFSSIIDTGTLAVSGAVTMYSTESVSGAVTLLSTLAVTSTTNLYGNTTVTGTFGVTGAVTLLSTESVTGNVTMYGTESVTGAVTMYSTLAVTGSISLYGNATVTGTMNVTGILTSTTGVSIGSSLSVGSSCTVNGTLQVSSLTTTNSLTVSGSSIAVITNTGTTNPEMLDIMAPNAVDGTQIYWYMGQSKATQKSVLMDFYQGTSGNSYNDAIFAMGFYGETPTSDFKLTKGGVLQLGTSVLSIGQGGVGYATGAGGTSSQATNKSTTVTLNKICGQITTSGAALASATTVTFTLSNTSIAAADNVVTTLVSGNSTAGTYNIWPEAIGASSCKINIRNISAGSLSEALVIAFTVLKGATS